jgi:transketolase
VESFGWNVIEIDGHDISQIKSSINTKTDMPICIIMNTIKGKGVSFMEGAEWHAKVPTKEEYILAKKELDNNFYE